MGLVGLGAVAGLWTWKCRQEMRSQGNKEAAAQRKGSATLSKQVLPSKQLRCLAYSVTERQSFSVA